MEAAKIVIGGRALIGRLHQAWKNRTGDKGTQVYQ